jgi:hypothetical protein
VFKVQQSEAPTKSRVDTIRSKKHKLEHQNSSDSQSSKSAQNEKTIVKGQKPNRMKANSSAVYDVSCEWLTRLTSSTKL